MRKEMRYRDGGDDVGTRAKTRLRLGISQKKQGGTSVFSVLSTITSDSNVHCSNFTEWLVPMIHPDLN